MLRNVHLFRTSDRLRLLQEAVLTRKELSHCVLFAVTSGLTAYLMTEVLASSSTSTLRFASIKPLITLVLASS